MFPRAAKLFFIKEDLEVATTTKEDFNHILSAIQDFEKCLVAAMDEGYVFCEDCGKMMRYDDSVKVKYTQNARTLYCEHCALQFDN